MLINEVINKMLLSPAADFRCSKIRINHPLLKMSDLPTIFRNLSKNAA
jgi:hypothetical protein